MRFLPIVASLAFILLSIPASAQSNNSSSSEFVTAILALYNPGHISRTEDQDLGMSLVGYQECVIGCQKNVYDTCMKRENKPIPCGARYNKCVENNCKN
jgi:hypothetical protein